MGAAARGRARARRRCSPTDDGAATSGSPRRRRRCSTRYFALEDPTRLEPAERELLVEATLESGLLLRGYVDRLDVAARRRHAGRRLQDRPGARARASRPRRCSRCASTPWCCGGCAAQVPRLLQLLYLGSGEVLRYEPDEADLLRHRAQGRGPVGGDPAGHRARRLAAQPQPAVRLVRPPGAVPGVRRHAPAAAGAAVPAVPQAGRPTSGRRRTRRPTRSDAPAGPARRRDTGALPAETPARAPPWATLRYDGCHPHCTLNVLGPGLTPVYGEAHAPAEEYPLTSTAHVPAAPAAVRRPGRRPHQGLRRAATPRSSPSTASTVDVRARPVHRDHGPVRAPGKSTLMHCLAGLDDAHRRRGVHRRHRPHRRSTTSELTQLRRDAVGFVFQAFNLVPTLTAMENITLPLDIAGRKPDQEWLDTVIDTVGLRDRLEPPAERALRRPAAAGRLRPRAGQPAGRSSSPTSRPATSTPRAAPRSSASCAASVDASSARPSSWSPTTRSPPAYADRVALPRRRPDRRRDGRPDRRAGARPDEAVRGRARRGRRPMIRATFRSLSRASCGSCCPSLSSCSASSFVVRRLRPHRHPRQGLRRPVLDRQPERRGRRPRRQGRPRGDQGDVPRPAPGRTCCRTVSRRSTASRRPRDRSRAARSWSARTARPSAPAAHRRSGSTGTTRRCCSPAPSSTAGRRTGPDRDRHQPRAGRPGRLQGRRHGAGAHRLSR